MYDMAVTPPSDASQRTGGRPWPLISGAGVAAAGVALAFVRYLGSGPHDNGNPEGWLASIGFAAPLIAAGLLAVVGALMDVASYWRAAGVVICTCSVVSIIMFPLLVPGLALIVIGGRPPPRVVTHTCGVAFAAALIGAFMIVVLHQDPATWAGGSSSNIVTTGEATMSVVVAVGGLIAATATAVRSRSPVRGWRETPRPASSSR